MVTRSASNDLHLAVDSQKCPILLAATSGSLSVPLRPTPSIRHASPAIWRQEVYILHIRQVIAEAYKMD
jgi:hypothetical protein